MARTVCCAGKAGSFSYVILDSRNSVVSSIRDYDKEIVTHHFDIKNAYKWTERQLRTLSGSDYETD